VIAVAILIAAAVAVFLVPGWLTSWHENRLLAAAQTSFGHGDLQSAVIACDQLLQSDPNSVEGCRLMLAINEQADSPRSIAWALKLADLSHDNPEALVKLATLGLKFGETGIAQDALNRVPESAKGTAAMLSIQAILAVTAGEFERAESLFERARRLEPSNLNWRLDLLKLQVQFRDPAHIDSARQELEQLAGNVNPAIKRDALRALLEDARGRSEPHRALAFAEKLASVPGAPLPDKLTLLKELRATSDKRFSVELAGLQRTIESSGNPGLIYQLMSWQNGQGLYRDSLDWAARLPNNLSKRLPIPVARCDALMALGDWPIVRTEVAGADWAGMNHLRFAIYARVEQVLGQTTEFQERWESAITATAGDWSALVSLANLAQRWGWQRQVIETLWLIARQPEGQHAALQQLYTFYERERNLTELYKVAKRYWEVYPKDPVAMNNVASLGLLLGEDTDQATKLAEKVYDQEPSVSAFAATYAFSMLRQDHPARALQVLQKLPQIAMADPSIGLYYGLALAATGQRDAAKAHLETALNSRRLFPEEQALARNVLER
jgi:Flp pilus assembly protein TadD